VNDQERALLLELAADLLREGRAEELVSQLAGADEVLSDPPTLGALFELQGSFAATSRLLDLAALGDPDVPLVLPLPGTAGAPGRLVGKAIEVDGIVLGSPSDQGVAVGTDSDDVLLVSGLQTIPLSGFDPDLGVTRVLGSRPVAHCVPAAVPGSWDAVQSRAIRALSWELLGVAGAALGVAQQHVTSRHQFGRPLAAFQTVAHRLADAAIAQAGAREVLEATTADLDLPMQRLVLKALAGRAALTTVQAAQQVCGAMGFTAEFGLHALVRRAYLLDSLFGGCENAVYELADLALAGAVPDRFVELTGSAHA
jgi:hypothetical protein